MSLEEKEGVVDRLTEKGVVLSGTWFGFSKRLKGPPLTEAHLGHRATVLFHSYMERPYIDVVKAIGEKVPGWKPPESAKGGAWMGGGRRMSPEELALKREEGVRIARSVAVDRAISAVKDGIAIEKIAPLARMIEGYLLSGRFTEAGHAPEKLPPTRSDSPIAQEAPRISPDAPKGPSPASASESEARPAAPASRTRRPDPKAVNALFNEAKLSGLVSDWGSYLSLCRGVAKSQVKSPYGLTLQEFAKVEADLRGRLSRGKVA